MRRSTGMHPAPRRPSLWFPAAVLLLAATVVVIALPSGLSPAFATPAGAEGGPVAQATTIAVGGGAAARHAAEPAQDRLGWTAAPGSLFTFALDDRLDLAVHSAEAGSQPGAVLHTRGTVQTLVLDRRGDETLVEHRLDVQLLGADERPLPADAAAASLLAAAAAPVLVRFTDDGRVRGFGFAETLDGDQRNFVRGLVGLFAIAAPRPDATQWTGPGQDTTGEFTAVHEQRAEGSDMVVRRTRQHYTRVTGHDELPEHTLEGAAEARFAAELGWLRSLRVDERLRMAISLLDLHTLAHRRTSLDCTAQGRAALPLDVAAAWASTSASVDGAGEVRGARAADDERRRWQQRLQATSLSALLQELQTLLAAPEVDSEAVDARFQDLQWLLRLDDRTTVALAELLASRQVDGAAARVALGALGAAGTDAAQQQLIALRADPGLGDELRQCATVSCLQLARPNATLRAELLRDARGDSPHAESSLLVLGALATRGAPAAAEPSSLQSLLAMEGEAAARGQLSTWLLAVANTRADVVEAISLRHLGHADAQVRAAACVGLGRVPGTTALRALLETGLTDLEPAVRHEAVMALSHRAEAEARAALQRVATEDLDQSVRERAQRLLGS